jgi:hypothetical protein
VKEIAILTQCATKSISHGDVTAFKCPIVGPETMEKISFETDRRNRRCRKQQLQAKLSQNAQQCRHGRAAATVGSTRVYYCNMLVCTTEAITFTLGWNAAGYDAYVMNLLTSNRFRWLGAPLGTDDAQLPSVPTYQFTFYIHYDTDSSKQVSRQAFQFEGHAANSPSSAPSAG